MKDNRPTIKITEYELNCIHWKEGHKLVWKESKRGATWTGNTRVVERPMNDAEYIEYLEKTKKEVWDCYHECEKHNSLLYKQRTALETKVNKLEKENQELKEHIKAISIGGIGNHRKQLLKDQFLKVVESVVKKYEIGKNEIHYVVGTQFKSSGNMVVAVIKEEYRKELLQEIKSAMENGRE